MKNIIKILKPYFLSLLFFFQVQEVVADDWQGSATAGTAFVYNDNIQLLPTNENSVTSKSLSLSATLIKKSELTDLSINLGGDLTNIDDETLKDKNSVFVNLAANTKGERYNLDLGVNYTVESTLDSELLDSGLLIDSSKESLSFNPGYTYQLDERSKLSLALAVTTASYDTNALSDFDRQSADLSWSYNVTQENRLLLGFSISQFEPVNAEKTETYSINIEYVSKIDEFSSYNVSVGSSEVKDSSSTSGAVNFKLSASRIIDDRSSFDLSLGRAFEDSAIGIVQETDRLTAGWSQQLTEKLNSTVSVNYVSTESRDFYSIQPHFNYGISNDISLTGVYIYSYQDNSIDKADSNSINIALTIKI